MFWRIAYASGKSTKMATTYGTITAEDGTKVELSKKSEIEEAIINENKKNIIMEWQEKQRK